VVGSACIELFLKSLYVSLKKWPPTKAPNATLGFGSGDSNHLNPSLHPGLASTGIVDPLDVHI